MKSSKQKDVNLVIFKPDSKVYTLQHSPYYIKSGIEQSLRRNIFHNVQYDSYELSMVDQLQSRYTFEHLQVPECWTNADTLKMLYSAKFDLKLAFQNTLHHLEWLHKMQNLSEEQYKEVDALFENFTISISGFDKQYRPIVIVKFAQERYQQISLAVEYLLFQIREQLLIPYYMEKWTVILDMGTEPVDWTRMDNDDVIEFIQNQQVNFCGNLNKVLIVNANAEDNLSERLSQFQAQLKCTSIPSHRCRLRVHLQRQDHQGPLGVAVLHQRRPTRPPIRRQAAELKLQMVSLILTYVFIARPPEKFQDQNLEEFTNQAKVVFFETQKRELNKFNKLGTDIQKSFSCSSLRNNSMRIVVHEENGNALIDQQYDSISSGNYEEENEDLKDFDQSDKTSMAQMQTKGLTKGWTQQNKTILESDSPDGQRKNCCSDDVCNLF